MHYQLSDREHGTKVNVQDLFGNMPVRVKQRGMLFGAGSEEDKQLGQLHHHVVGLLLAWDVPVMVTIRGTGSAKKLTIRGKGSFDKILRNRSSCRSFDLSLMRSVLSQAAYIDPSEWDTWIKTSARTPLITIQGAISLQPGPSKHVQFIALGVHYLDPEFGGNVIYDEINRLFTLSNFGRQEDIPDSEGQKRRSKDRRFKQDGFTNKQLKGAGKGVDKWPRFSLRIQLHDDSNFGQTGAYAALERDNTLSSILKVLRALVDGFLQDHHFRPRSGRTRNHPKPPQNTLDYCSPRSLPPALLQTTLGTGTFKCFASPPPESRSQSTTVQIPRELSRTKDIMKASKRAHQTISTPMDDDLGSSVKLPKFSRDCDCEAGDYFRRWSRIKSGKSDRTHDEFSGLKPGLKAKSQALRSGISDLVNLSAEPIGDNGSKSEVEHVEDSRIPEDSSNEVSAFGNDVPALDDPFIEDESLEETVPLSDPQMCETTPQTEQIYTWINPVTKAVVLVNARTGLVVLPQSARPHSASANDPSQSWATSYSKGGVTLRSQKRLIHSASAPFPTSDPRSWISGFLESWENPVFKPTEERIPQISLKIATIENKDIGCCHKNAQNAFTEASSSLFAKLSKRSLAKAKVIAQVHKKFILVRMEAFPISKKGDGKEVTEEQLLVLIDQHAADERIRVEKLFADLSQIPTSETRKICSSLSLTSAIETKMLQTPIAFHIQAREHRLFTIHSRHFADWGILFDLSAPLAGPTAVESALCKLTVKTLPAVIAERCRSDPKVLIELLRGEAWRQEEPGVKNNARQRSPSPALSVPLLSSESSSAKPSWLSKISSCPPSILDMVNSRACRTAIMFNDTLTVGECSTLIASLANCVFPFQCAHGRPSMVPLADLGSIDGLDMDVGGQREVDKARTFGEDWMRWRGSGEKHKG